MWCRACLSCEVLRFLLVSGYICQPTWQDCHTLILRTWCLLALIILSCLPDLDPVLLILTRVSMLSSFPLSSHLSHLLITKMWSSCWYIFPLWLLPPLRWKLLFLNCEFGFLFYSSFLKSRVLEDGFKKSHGHWEIPRLEDLRLPDWTERTTFLVLTSSTWKWAV